MVERRKAEAIVAKKHKTRGGISLSSKQEDENDTKDTIDPN